MTQMIVCHEPTTKISSNSVYLGSLKTEEKFSFLGGQSIEGLRKAHHQTHTNW